ncbi:MAG: 5-(carboxyamino)imidazole ribonucleotide mutase [Candidatus Omnitrophica bacterium]|nr:5-(carboxyamino)imidazole ribonucleotide mutase [Candidatus Omnitrophota bacterium]
MRKKPIVSIIMGSDSDLEVMKESSLVLEGFGIAHEVKILSAHRSPKLTSAFAEKAAGKGIKVIIAGAGGAAHLAGVVASHTTIPVIGVPMDTKALKGIDSLLSTVQMPSGIPVATVAIGKTGAKNAAILAAEILSLGDQALKKKLIAHKKSLVKIVKEKNKLLCQKPRCLK